VAGTLFSRHQLARELKLSEQRLPLLSCLLGNDQIQQEDHYRLKSLCASELPKPTTDLTGSQLAVARVEAAAVFARAEMTPADSLKRISRLSGVPEKRFQAGLQQSVTNFICTSLLSTYFRYF
jgi:hypothetical protein